MSKFVCFFFNVVCLVKFPWIRLIFLLTDNANWRYPFSIHVSWPCKIRILRGSSFYESSLHQYLNNEYRCCTLAFYLFAINDFCLLTLFRSSRGRVPFFTILNWFHLFLRATAIQKRPLSFFRIVSIQDVCSTID